MTFKALVTDKAGDAFETHLKDVEFGKAAPGDVTIAVEWSTVNYKDGLGLYSGRIMQRYPMTGGIDFAGTVEASEDPRYVPGQKVLANGWGLSQTHDGGYAEKVRVPADWLIPLPAKFTTREAMAIGTAGYTAMLCVLALEHGGLTPQRGDIVVTGANGGVGSITISILSTLGYKVIASTGRTSEADYLRRLGASEVVDRAYIIAGGKPMGRERWAGAVDSLGGQTLASLLAQTSYRGVVAACGRAQAMDLPGSMAPFILRNITLAGIDSVNTPREVRLEAWSRLARDLDPARLKATITEITLEQVPEVAAMILKGAVQGRTVVNING